MREDDGLCEFYLEPQDLHAMSEELATIDCSDRVVWPFSDVKELYDLVAAARQRLLEPIPKNGESPDEVHAWFKQNQENDRELSPVNTIYIRLNHFLLKD